MNDIWYRLRDHEQYVYHYTGATTLIEHILPKRRLRFSSFAELNDPREYKKFDLDPFAADTLGDDCREITAKMEVALKADWKIACFVGDPIVAVIDGGGRDFGANQLDSIHERGHSRPRMWAQYADSHKGVCLVFRKQPLDLAVRSYAQRTNLRSFSGSVAYRNVPVVGHWPGPFAFSMDDIRQYGLARTAERHVDRYLQELYLTKNRDWEAEHEFRWLLRGAGDEALVDFEDSLVGIAIGELFPNELKSALGNYAMNYNIEIAVMDWRRAIPQPKPLPHRALLNTR